jgi:prophage antirepressor-like protein
MEIVKAFNENGMSHTITIKGTSTNPLFRASDIGSILEISNVRQSIKDFDNTEKVAVSITDSIGREQNVSFLTELGLYQLLFISRKPVAKIFKKWVCEVIKEIRLNGVYDLQKQL